MGSGRTGRGRKVKGVEVPGRNSRDQERERRRRRGLEDVCNNRPLPSGTAWSIRRVDPSKIDISGTVSSPTLHQRDRASD